LLVIFIFIFIIIFEWTFYVWRQHQWCQHCSWGKLSDCLRSSLPRSIPWWNSYFLLLLFIIIIFFWIFFFFFICLSSHLPQILPFHNHLKSTRHFKSNLFHLILFVAGLYILFTFGCYVTFGNKCLDPITLNFGWCLGWIVLVYICMCVFVYSF
jgi:hypothetical protein